MSQNSFMLLSETKGPLIKLDDNDNYSQINESALQQRLANRTFFKSTPSLAPSIQSSIYLYKNTNANYINYEFKPIRQKPKSNPNLSATLVSRELFTPDSLESLSSTCSLSESDDNSTSNNNNNNKNNIINRDKESLCEEDEQVNSKTDSGLSISPQLTHSSTNSEDKHFDLDIDFETDEEICQLTERNESSIILEKLEKINRLQEKINDINQKIKSIDMNSNSNYYSIDHVNKTNNNINNIDQNDKDNEWNDTDENEQKVFDEKFRNRNNQTRMGVRAKLEILDDDDDDEDTDNQNVNDSNPNKQHFETNYLSDEDQQYQQDEEDDDDNYENYEDDEDEHDQEECYTIIRQAQPIRKYASTGFLFNRYGSYLAPIEESPEEALKSSSSNSSILSTDSSDYLTQPTTFTRKTSTSCFNLEFRIKSETCNISTQTNEITKNNVNASNSANLILDYHDQDHFNYDDLLWPEAVHDFSLLIEREEFVDSSSLIQSYKSSKEENKEGLDILNENDKSTSKVLENYLFKMVDVFDSPETCAQNDTVDPIDGIIPEDNVERLRNIRDMFENKQDDDLVELKKVEKLQPSEKLKQTFLNDKQISTNNPNHNFNQHQQFLVTMEEVNDKHKSINGDSLCMYESQQTDAVSLSASVSSSVTSIPSPSAINHLLDNQENNIRFEEGVVVNNDEEELIDETAKIGYNNKDIMPFADLNNVKTKFESISMETAPDSNEPKPIRCITPPREGADRAEIENEPMARRADVVSVYERVEDTLPDAGYIKSRREIFSSVSSPSIGADTAGLRSKKSITPPRDDILKRVLKEKTPERLDNVTRESDRSEDVLPSAGSIKQTAAIFNSGGARQRSIERSGITIEGELTEKGIAKSRLALFSDPTALASSNQHAAQNNNEQELMNASGIAKERLNLFKNLEQSNNGQRTSPERSVKKLKEFTPPPQMEPRQYIIIDRESQSPPPVDVSAYNKDEFVPETGLAKNRMKQYLDQASTNNANETSISETSELQGKGLAKSLLAKWKSIENIKDVTSPADGSKRHTSSNNEQDEVPIAGTAKSLLTKWQNIDTTATTNGNKENWERKGLKAFTPPPQGELDKNDNHHDNNDDNEHDEKLKQQQNVFEDELALLKGAAKNTLKKFEQSLAESNTPIKRTVTPPKEFISQLGQASVKTVFESQPVESNINAHYAEEEIIPPQGYAKNLKQKFLNLEKEAAKIETSSSKMNYVPKKFTSSTTPAYQNKEKSVKQPSKPVGKLNATNGLLTTASNGHNGQSNEICSTCDKTVYVMEKIEADKKVYHKACFKCTSCNCPLKLGNFSSIKQTLYCTPHFLQLFARNGNYDEGFGLENYKRKWLSQQQNAQPTAAN